MNKNLNNKGASKRKGAAESEELTEKGPVDGMDESGAGKKKGAAQVGYDAIIQHGIDIEKMKKKADQKLENDRFAAGILDSINMESRGDVDSKGDNKAISTYGVNYGQYASKDADGKNQNYLGDQDFVMPSDEAYAKYMNTTKKELQDNVEAKKVSENAGANRMGFTQNFGAARQNGYAKGAAKVASIMNFGAAKYGGNKGDESESKRDYEG